MIFENRTNLALAVSLAGLAGFTDAVGFHTLGGFFVSFMTGNSTRLAVNLAELDLTALALLPLGIIALFACLWIASGLALALLLSLLYHAPLRNH